MHAVISYCHIPPQSTPPTHPPTHSQNNPQRPIKQCLPVLLRDITAVASGARSTALLDYLHYPPTHLLALLQPHTGLHLLVCVLDMCAYVINVWTMRRVVEGGGVPRRCVVFEGLGGGGMVARLANDVEQKVGVVCWRGLRVGGGVLGVVCWCVGWWETPVKGVCICSIQARHMCIITNVYHHRPTHRILIHKQHNVCGH